MKTDENIDVTDIDESELPIKNDPETLDFHPLKLNKNLIIIILFSTLCIGIFCASVLPLFLKKQKKLDTKVPVAASVQVPQFKTEQPKQEEISGETDDEIIASLPEPEIPPIAPPRQNESVNNTGSSQVNSGLYPDTRMDPIQKSIAGIKGISSTGAANKQYGSPSPNPMEQQGTTTNPYAQFGLPPKEDYINRISSQMANAQGQNSYTAQNNQSNKESFFNGNQNGGTGHFNSVFSLWQGTSIPALLVTGINTDLPGNIIARVSANIHSSLDGRYLLIPEGSLLIARYNSNLSYAQNRVQIAWDTLIRPDGYELNLGGMPATDSKGRSGIAGFKSENFFEYLKAAGIMAAFTIMNGEFASFTNATENKTVENIIAGAQNITNQMGAKLIDRALDVQPTIFVAQGTRVNILLNKTIELPPLERYPVTEKYIRR